MALLEELGQLAGLDKIGITAVSIAIMYFGFKVFQIFTTQWKQSTEAVNRNTKSFEKLSAVFEKSNEREMEFQKNVMAMLSDGNKLIVDTHKKVGELHGSLIHKRRKEDPSHDEH